MKWVIAKEFGFDYGHRVWSQELEGEFSLDTQCACRHLHGHRGTLMVHLESESLKNGMVTDFKHLNWFKKFLDDNFDHKFIIDRNDPALHHILFNTNPDGSYALNTFSNQFTQQPEGHWTYRREWATNIPHYVRDSVIEELYEGFVIVPFVPTSENLCKWFYELVQEKMKPLGVTVSKIQFFETPKSQSNYGI